MLNTINLNINNVEYSETYSPQLVEAGHSCVCANMAVSATTIIAVILM